MSQPLSPKGAAELEFWQSRLQQQGVLTNDHYEYFYTTHFGWSRAFYRGKRVLDIGCGPRGSLEWATGAALRVGVDPLAAAYRQLGTARHAMHYVTGVGEALPFAGAAFDVVCSFNSLDHVDDLEPVIGEIGRVVAPGGYFLLIADIHQYPTLLEPSGFSWDIGARFLPALAVVEEKQVEYSVRSPEGFGNIYASLRQGIPYNHADATARNGVLAVKFCKSA